MNTSVMTAQYLRFCGAAALATVIGFGAFLLIEENGQGLPDTSERREARAPETRSSSLRKKTRPIHLSMPERVRLQADRAASDLSPGEEPGSSPQGSGRENERLARELQGEINAAMAEIRTIEDPDERRLAYREFLEMNREVMAGLRSIYESRANAPLPPFTPNREQNLNTNP